MYSKNKVITSKIYQKCQNKHFILKKSNYLCILKKKTLISFKCILSFNWPMGKDPFNFKTRKLFFFREGVSLALTSVSEASPPKLSCIHCDLWKILWCLYSTSESYSFESLRVDKPLSKQLSGKLSTSQFIRCIGSQRAKES